MDVRDMLADCRSAVGLLTRLPLRFDDGDVPRGAAASWVWPVAGALCGLLSGFVLTLAVALALPPGLCAALVLATQALVTGAIHEDGLADTADGFWGGWTRDRRLAIMKDSHIGTYGVMALLLVTLARWSALVTLLSGGAGIWALVGVAALSRAPMALILAALPNARGTGLSNAVGRADWPTAMVGMALACVIAVPGLGWAVMPALLMVGLVTVGVAMLARARIGGQTGDVLGAAQQLAELVLLATLTALW